MTAKMDDGVEEGSALGMQGTPDLLRTQSWLLVVGQS